LFYFNEFEISLHEPKVLNNTLFDHLNLVCEIVLTPTNKRRDGNLVIFWEFGPILQFLNVDNDSAMIKFLNRNLSWVMSLPLPWARNKGKGLQRCELRVKPMNHILCS